MMADTAAQKAQSQPGTKTVQEYIDELPVWPDGTALKSTPMTGMQWRIWTLAAFGKFFEGFVVFMTGVALPLLSREFDISAAENGLITALSHCDPRAGRRLRRGLRQDRGGLDRVLFPHSSHHYRHASPALRPDRKLDPRRSGYLVVPDRDDRREPRHVR
jgi:hypothetical protein